MRYINRNIEHSTPDELHRLAKRKALSSLDGAPQFDSFTTDCERCGGAGGWRGWPGYTCFRCGGERVDPTAYVLKVISEPTADWKAAAQDVLDRYFKTVDKREADRRAEAAAAQAEQDRAWAAIVDANSEIAEAEEMVASGNAPQIVESILSTCKRNLTVSDKQRNALIKIMASEKQKAERPVLTDGRQTVTGTVRKVREQYGQYGTQWKCTVVLDNGNVLYGTHGSKFPAEGGRVRFDATIELSKDDEHFGFYKRPTKVVVEQEECNNVD